MYMYLTMLNTLPRALAKLVDGEPNETQRATALYETREAKPSNAPRIV